MVLPFSACPSALDQRLHCLSADLAAAFGVRKRTCISNHSLFAPSRPPSSGLGVSMGPARPHMHLKFVHACIYLGSDGDACAVAAGLRW